LKLTLKIHKPQQIFLHGALRLYYIYGYPNIWGFNLPHFLSLLLLNSWPKKRSAASDLARVTTWREHFTQKWSNVNEKHQFGRCMPGDLVGNL